MNRQHPSLFARLRRFCRTGDLAEIEALLNRQTPWPETPPHEQPLLHTALKHGHWPVARHLLKLRSELDQDPTPALVAASQCKRDDITGIELILTHNDDANCCGRNGRTALMTSALLGHVEKVKRLLQQGARVNPQDSHGMSALLDAASAGHTAMCALLLEHGAQVNQSNRNGENALWLAMHSGENRVNEALIRLLLDHNADPSARTHRGKNALDALERLPKNLQERIRSAAFNSQQMELPLFADTPANEAPAVAERELPEPHSARSDAVASVLKTEPCSAPDGWFEAAMQGHIGRINNWLAGGCEINARDEKGCTALIHACGCNHRALASFLLQKHADATLRSDNGSTALSSAVMGRSNSVVELLLRHGVDANGRGPGDYPCISLAVSQWNDGALSLLLAQGADLETRDPDGNGLMHLLARAAEYYSDLSKARATLQCLQQHRLDIDQLDGLKNSALHILCGAHKQRQYRADDARVAALVHQLLKNGAQAKRTNQTGHTALQLAKKHRLNNTAGVILSFLNRW